MCFFNRRVYLVRPEMTTMKVIADHINSDRNNNIKRQYRIIMVPRRVLKTHCIILCNTFKYCQFRGVYRQMDHLPQQWKIFCVKTFVLSVLSMGLSQI